MSYYQLPDNHTRELTLTLSVAEFRELMRSAAYVHAERPTEHPGYVALSTAMYRLGSAWDSAGQVDTIGREILRLDAEFERDSESMGKSRRTESATRRKALVWALHVLLTGDTTEPPGEAVEAFLGALKAREGASE
ncbi:hypothetical protein [Kitasatospora sp. NPDC001132]